MSWSIISHLTTCILVEEIAFEIGYFLHKLDRVIGHTVTYHSSTSNYKLNFVQIRKTFCGQLMCRRTADR